MVSPVALWYEVLHFSRKLEIDVAPAPVRSYATADGVTATTAATATTTAFVIVEKRMVCLS
jgi:hypothetical protein